MNIKPFLVEEWMNKYEAGAKYNIAETCVDSISLRELWESTGIDGNAFWSNFCEKRLTYGDIEGLPAFREGICGLFAVHLANPVVHGQPVLLDHGKPDPDYMEELLDILHLTGRRSHLPGQLSGGQQQRTAIGRALFTRPSLILADEPTGNLDSGNSREVIELLKKTSAKYQQTILLITHNPSIAQAADRVLSVSDGVVTDMGRTLHEELS